MQKTKYLYDENPYETKFESVVLSCEKTEAGYETVLRETQFFPEQGGQTPDRGWLSGEKVTDVKIRDGVIYHVTEKPMIVGETVSGEVDWERRFGNMQQHTGEHIFSGIVYRTYGYQNVGFHLSDAVVTMDFDGALSREQAAEVERWANEVIYQNLPIEVSFPSDEELAKLDYRSKKEIEGDIRIVTIPKVDICACCAPHVRQTGEIGILKVMSVQSYKGGVRISILCGKRALMAFREKSLLLSELTETLSAGQDELIHHVKRLLEENKNLRYELEREKENALLEKIKKIPKEQENVILFAPASDSRVMRNAVNHLTLCHDGYCGIFSGDDDNGYRFILGSKNKDCNEATKLLREELAAKGGGNAKMIQGSICAKASEITAALSSL